MVMMMMIMMVDVVAVVAVTDHHDYGCRRLTMVVVVLKNHPDQTRSIEAIESIQTMKNPKTMAATTIMKVKVDHHATRKASMDLIDYSNHDPIAC